MNIFGKLIGEAKRFFGYKQKQKQVSQVEIPTTIYLDTKHEDYIHTGSERERQFWNKVKRRRAKKRVGDEHKARLRAMK